MAIMRLAKLKVSGIDRKPSLGVDSSRAMLWTADEEIQSVSVRLSLEEDLPRGLAYLAHLSTTDAWKTGPVLDHAIRL